MNIKSPELDGKEQEVSHDLRKLQKNHFESSQRNTTEANNAMARFQNWTLVLSLAELAFLGSFISQSQSSDYMMFFAKIIISILLLGLLLFLFGSLLQIKHLLKSARQSYALSNKVLEHIIETKHVTVDKIPSDLKVDPKESIKSNKWSNVFIFSGFVFAIFATVLLVIFLFRL